MPAHKNETITAMDAPTAHRDRGDANYSRNHHALGVGPQTSQQDYHGREGKEETRKKTERILEEFLKRSIKANGSAVRQKGRLNNNHQARLHEASRVVTHCPRKAPLIQSDERKLQDLMSGTGLYRSSHQMSATSLSSSGSEGERFHRTQSFAKAQRHSVVTKLEHEAEEKTSKRRNSEDIQSQPLDPESSITEATDRSSNTAPPHVVHSRASSDPVTNRYGVAEKIQPHKKSHKAKKSWTSIFSFKKRSVHKLDKDSEAFVESDVCGPPGNKFPRTPSDRSNRKVTRESSVNDRRSTPSPPKSRTPKILRRFSSRFKKSPSLRSESPTGSHLKTPGSSQSFDAVLEASRPADGETKSNSLPKEAVLSTHHSRKTHHSRVVIDGSSKHGYKHTKDAERPSSLDLHAKKKKSIGSRLKNFFIESSSSSSSSLMSSASEPDLTQLDHIAKPSASTKGAEQTVKHTNPDPKPDPATTRRNYQHNASKSMSDIDHNNPNLVEIAEKLKSIAIALQQTKYVGPSGKTQTPDSYHHDNRTTSEQNHGVNRSKSTPTAKATSMSMKTYYNMEASKQTRSGRANEAGHSPLQSRIKRTDVKIESWLQRVAEEKRPGTNTRLTHERHQKDGAPSKISKSLKSSVAAAPSPRQSSSPDMRGARAHRRNVVVTDGGHGPHRTVVRYERHEEDIVTTVSATGVTERHNSVDTYQVVQTDAGTFDGDGEDDVDFADAWREDEEKETPKHTVTGNAEEEVAQAPLRPRGRAATEPAVPAYDELDNVTSDSDEGAVGGQVDLTDTEEDKLVQEIVATLRKKGDTLNAQEQTIELSKFLVDYATRTTEIAVIFDLIATVQTMQPIVGNFLTSVINHIAFSAGGWPNVMQNYDETKEEIRGWGEGGYKHDRDEGELD